ncbi:hypothetical protein BDA96_10G092400, partial [Sorghum bicolor]
RDNGGHQGGVVFHGHSLELSFSAATGAMATTGLSALLIFTRAKRCSVAICKAALGRVLFVLSCYKCYA